MLSVKKLFSKKLVNYLVFRTFFKTYDFIFICTLVHNDLTSLDLLKLKLNKLNINFQFFNSNYLFLNGLNSNYLKFFQNSGLILKINDLNCLAQLPTQDILLSGGVYKEYFLNNVHLKNIFSYFKFYDGNLLFLITFFNYLLNIIYLFIFTFRQILRKCQLIVLLLSKN